MTEKGSALDGLLSIFARKPYRERWVAIGNKERRTKLYQWANLDSSEIQTSFPSNTVRTARYRWWNFVPLNLFHQFRRLVNFYFLVTIVVTFALQDRSPVSPLTWFYALVAVVLMTMIKQGYEDYLRYRKDRCDGNSISCFFLLLLPLLQTELKTWRQSGS